MTDEAEERIVELQRRTRLRTNYDPEEFIEAYEMAGDSRQRSIVRGVLRSLDSGRFHEFLDEAHNILAKSDIKRREAFEENFSDHLILWIKAFGTVEDLNTFPEIEV